MIIKRQVVLYHVTRIENLASIKKEGLKTVYFKDRKENELLGIRERGVIYFVKDRNKLVKPLRPGKDCMIEVRIPLDEYQKLSKIEGDLEWKVMQDDKNYLRRRSEVMKKAYPEQFSGMSVEDIMSSSTPMEYMSPENSVCILQDILPKYITNVYYK